MLPSYHSKMLPLILTQYNHLHIIIPSIPRTMLLILQMGVIPMQLFEFSDLPRYLA
jgi:hypothetical protein